MRYTKDRKEQTRSKILLSACRRFASQGYAATTIDAIMRDCALTRGGFYAHFKSKAQLYRDAMRLAASMGRATRREREDWIEYLIDDYLAADSHAFLATDVASVERDVRAAYEQSLRELHRRLAEKIAARVACSEATALSLTAMIVGAIAVARSIDDDALKLEVSAACKATARILLENANASALSFFWEPLSVHDRARMRKPGGSTIGAATGSTD